MVRLSYTYEDFYSIDCRMCMVVFCQPKFGDTTIGFGLILHVDVLVGIEFYLPGRYIMIFADVVLRVCQAACCHSKYISGVHS